MEKFTEFGKAVVDFVITVFWLIYMFFAFVFGAIGNFFKNLDLPILPSTTRVFQESWIVVTLLIIFIIFFLVMNISAFNLFRKDKIMAQCFEPEDFENVRRYTRIGNPERSDFCDYFCGTVFISGRNQQCFYRTDE